MRSTVLLLALACSCGGALTVQPGDAGITGGGADAEIPGPPCACGTNVPPSDAGATGVPGAPGNPGATDAGGEVTDPEGGSVVDAGDGGEDAGQFLPDGAVIPSSVWDDAGVCVRKGSAEDSNCTFAYPDAGTLYGYVCPYNTPVPVGCLPLDVQSPFAYAACCPN